MDYSRQQQRIIRSLEAKLGSGRKSGWNIYFDCPFCNDTRRRMGVEIRKQIFGCFNCNAGGTLSALFREIGVERRARIVPERVIGEPEFQSGLNRIDLPEHYTPIGNPVRGFLMRRAVTYLQNRGLGMDWIVKHNVGYCPDGPYIDRVIFPMFHHGDCVYWVARSIIPDVKPKTKHPAGVRRPVWTFEPPRKSARRLIIVEGLFDAIPCPDSVALLGSTASRSQLDFLLKLRPKEYILMFDGDKAGIDGAVKLGTRLQERTEAPVTVVELPDGLDPADLRTEENLRPFIENRRRLDLRYVFSRRL